MTHLWKKKRLMPLMAGMVTAGLLAVTIACRAFPLVPAPSLLPVDAPLAPAVPGTVFAPEAIASPENLAEQTLPPRSTGTHITASLVRADKSRLVAVWGDPVLWEERSGVWSAARNVPRLTGTTAEVVTLTDDATTGRVIIGTRRNGRFQMRFGEWQPLPHPNVPYNANAQALAAYRGSLFAATLDDGLVVRDGKGAWQHVAPPTISTLAPRQFIVWHDDLWVRHGNGVVDRFDGRSWTSDVFTKRLPRRQVSALATDGDTLLLAQWGGWSETRDGAAFTHRFPDALKAIPITALCATQDSLYLGTQGRGIAQFRRAEPALNGWSDERQGLGDDWITTLTPSTGGTLVAGTFVSGAYRNTGNGTATWQALPGSAKDCVTAAAPVAGGTLVGTRRGGVHFYSDTGTATVVTTRPEVQCLLTDPANRLLWIGTRTGIVTAPLPR